MNYEAGVILTDGINRKNEMLELSALIGSVEAQVSAAVGSGLANGMPVNMSHDKCRPVGWCVPMGVYIAKDMGRQLAKLMFPTTDAEKQKIAYLIREFDRNYQKKGAEPFKDELIARLQGSEIEGIEFWEGEAVAAYRDRLAADVFPDFFSTNGTYTDKDGLVDYNELLSKTTQIQPGVFHEPNRDVLVFAHRFFRRSLSHKNSLNQYVLESFHQAATACNDVAGRLRLDPDLIGHPKSARSLVELEFWRGPKFNDEIGSIPAGVTEHKSDQAGRSYSSIDKTQIWWKNPEQRQVGRPDQHEIRTFEIEELIEDPSPGLEEHHFGCRYAHAEYDLSHRNISHFDGAIRAYGGEAYLERIDRSIDRAGKQSDYTKLFRLDGSIPVNSWKRVLTDFYRGNKLVPEYLGAPLEDIIDQASSADSELIEECLPTLSAYVGISSAVDAASLATFRVIVDQLITYDGKTIPFAEVGQGRVAELLRGWIDCDQYCTFGAKHPIANLSKIALPGDPPCLSDWIKVSTDLRSAITQDIADGNLESVSLVIAWTRNKIATVLAIAGEAKLVAKLLLDAGGIVKPDQAAETWINPFRDALRSHAPDLDAPVHWPRSVLEVNRIIIPRTGDTRFTLVVPKALAPSANAFGENDAN